MRTVFWSMANSNLTCFLSGQSSRCKDAKQRDNRSSEPKLILSSYTDHDQVGGSLGGICAGLVLKGLGHNVRILERNPTPLLHNQGAGIVAGGYVQELFDRYDSTHRQIAVTSRMRHYLSRQGGAVSEEHRAQTMTSWDLLYHVLRANFVGLQSGYTETRGTAEGEGSATYEYGCLVDKVEYEAGKVKLGFKNREGHQDSTSADLVIAADGPSSSVRRILLPQIQRRYAGYVAWRGTVPETEVSAESKQTFVEKFAFYTETGIQILWRVKAALNLEPVKLISRQLHHPGRKGEPDAWPSAAQLGVVLQLPRRLHGLRRADDGQPRHAASYHPSGGRGAG